MPLINHTKKEINAKLVLFGPAGAGKATNLTYIYKKLKESFKGKLKSMSLQGDRMLFFDFIPAGDGNVEGYSVRFHIYTLSSEVTHPASWKMVLKGVDGLVVVADSSPDRMTANMESYKELGAHLAAYGRTLRDIPCVLQCNKRDVAGAVDPEVIRSELAFAESPVHPAVAAKGEGVLESVFTLVKMVLKQIRAGGLDVGGQPEQLHRVAEASGYESAEVKATGTAAAEAPRERSEPEHPALEKTPAETGDEPVLEITGAPEVINGGTVRLPLSIKSGGKTKRMSLQITLATETD